MSTWDACFFSQPSLFAIRKTKRKTTDKPNPPTNFLFSLESSECASSVAARLAAADRWRGTALPACTTKFLSSPPVLVPPGIPSSHCSAFVYRKPDTNEIAAGTLGSKFPQAHAVLIPFPLPPTSQAVDTLLIASVLQLWEGGGAER